VKFTSAALLLIITARSFCETKQPSAQPIIPLYTLYSLSHEQFYTDWFLPTLQDTNYRVMIREVEQRYPSGIVASAQWQQAMLDKVDVILSAIKENWENVFIFSDVDIQFFAPTWPDVQAAIDNHDMAIQAMVTGGEKTDTNILCTGFFACRANKQTLKLWRDIQTCIARLPHTGEQDTLNDLLHHHNNTYQIRYCLLPETFMCGKPDGRRLWWQAKTVCTTTIPDGVMLHHANYTQSLADKIDQLRYVRRVVEERTRKSSSL